MSQLIDKKSQNDYVSGIGYIVASLSKGYLTTKGIICVSLKLIRQF